MPDGLENWELPPEAPSFVLGGDAVAALFPEITTSNNVTISNSSFDISALPNTFRMTIDGEPFLVRGEVNDFDAMTGLNGMLETRPYSWTGGSYAPLLNEYGEYESLEELDMAERNTRKILSIADLPDVTEDDESYGQLDDMREGLKDLPRIRQELLEEQALEAAEANACNGSFNRLTGEIEHSGSPICAIHAK